MKNLDISNTLTIAGSVSKPLPTFIAFSPVSDQTRQLAQKLSKGIAALRQEGVLQTILAKYALKDWKGS